MGCLKIKYDFRYTYRYEPIAKNFHNWIQLFMTPKQKRSICIHFFGILLIELSTLHNYLKMLQFTKYLLLN